MKVEHWPFDKPVPVGEGDVVTQVFLGDGAVRFDIRNAAGELTASRTVRGTTVEGIGPGTMNEQRAREILGDYDGNPDLATDFAGCYIRWLADLPNSPARLDGHFSADQLEAIAWWMRNKGDGAKAAPALFLGAQVIATPRGVRGGELVPLDPDEFGVIAIDTNLPEGE